MFTCIKISPSCTFSIFRVVTASAGLFFSPNIPQCQIWFSSNMSKTSQSINYNHLKVSKYQSELRASQKNRNFILSRHYGHTPGMNFRLFRGIQPRRKLKFFIFIFFSLLSTYWPCSGLKCKISAFC